VGADYFNAVGLPLLRGRGFTPVEALQSGSPPVVVINDQLAKQLWPDGDALGRQVQLAGDDPTLFEVVGIVPATRHTLFESRPDAGVYLPFAVGFQSHVYFHVKFASLPAGREQARADMLRHEVHEVDPSLPILSVRSFAQHLEGNIQIWIVRAGAALFAVFGGLALCLAVVGAYGVISYSVARRTREIGIRMALGAQPEAVQRQILRENLVMLLGGLALGLLLALGVGKVVSSLLYRVGALDPLAFTLAPSILALTAFLACWIPTRRATKVSPMVALRAE
jgi:hypothetical protein